MIVKAKKAAKPAKKVVKKAVKVAKKVVKKAVKKTTKKQSEIASGVYGGKNEIIFWTEYLTIVFRLSKNNQAKNKVSYVAEKLQPKRKMCLSKSCEVVLTIHQSRCIMDIVVSGAPQGGSNH